MNRTRSSPSVSAASSAIAEVRDVDRVERPAEDTERSRHDRPWPVAHTRSQGCASHSSSVAADPHEVAGRDPGPAQLGVDAEAGQVALEALCGLLDVEVRLGGDPLDARAADAERTVGVEVDAEPVAHGLDPMDDDARRLGWLGQLGGVGQELRDPSAERVETVAEGRRDGDGVDTFLRSRAPESRPCFGGGRDVELVEGDQDRLLEECRIMGAQLVPDDVVVPARVARRAIDHVDEDPGPLDVAEEGVSEARRRCSHPRSGPGTSAIVGRRSSSSPRSMTPRLGSSVVNG